MPSKLYVSDPTRSYRPGSASAGTSTSNAKPVVEPGESVDAPDVPAAVTAQSSDEDSLALTWLSFLVPLTSSVMTARAMSPGKTPRSAL